ncbi:hypothetical protein CQ042_15685 [Microbacterium sp. MYb62]|nr:hypothetical protein CQ042_15685 [Microbacterium sp. MYb62]
MTMTKRFAIFGSIGLIALVGVVVLGVVVIVPAITKAPGPGDQFAYPIGWQLSRQPDAENTATARITLNEDGTAEFAGTSMGRVERSPDGRSCVSEPEEAVSGAGSWEMDQDGALRVRSDVGEAVFLPGQGRFSGRDWSELSGPFCDGTSADFSPTAATR